MHGLHELLAWHYLIFEIPLAIGGFMMLMTIAHPHGGHGGHGHHGGHFDHVGHVSHAGHHAAPTHAAQHPGTQQRVDARADSRNIGGMLLALIGASKAPLPLVIEAGLLGWGVFGFCANMLFQQVPAPAILMAAPSLFVAGIGSFATMHVSGAVFARFMPKDETSAVSRGSLFGLTGNVVYPVSESGGRVHIYDQYGTLHDETCRVAAGQPELAKGSQAIVIDIDERGQIIVEEIA